MKKTIAIVWLILLFAAISGMFWRNEWVYSLPTPVPQHYKPVNPGQVIDLGSLVNSSNKKPRQQRRSRKRDARYRQI